MTDNLKYDAVSGWLAWGPYLWADGTTARSDGLVWNQSDFESDGNQPSQSGEDKVATLMMDFFKNSPHTQCWFKVGGVCQ